MNGGQWKTNNLNETIPDQWTYPGNIYIEKFTTIGTSELRWDISGLFLDDTDIYGFLLINSIIVHMTVHFL